MKASTLYRVAAVLLVLFAAGHLAGFTLSDPSWHVELLLTLMRSIHFDIGGIRRSYWDLFVAAGTIVGLCHLFAAALAWELGGLPAELLARLKVARWGFAILFAAIAVVSA